MSDNSAIEWTDATWNPVTGCTKVSPGCDHCYAETFAERFRGVAGHHFANGFDVTLRPERLGQPLRWRRPRRVFVNSMSDLFHDAVPDEYIAEVFAVMAAANWHTFQVLTKRHGRLRSLLNSPAFRELVQLESATLAHEGIDIITNNPWENWPLPNVWIGCSVEDQQWADIRIPALLDTPAACRFLSCEPLLGPVDLSDYLGLEWGDIAQEWLPELFSTLREDKPGIHWVIAGGESGHAARPIDPDWVRQLRDQCVAAGVPYFMKQWGGRNKKATGRELDGRTWDESPAVTS
jgi:protein gp37